MDLLRRINNNADLREIKDEDLPALCGEIRKFLIEKVSQTGGHLASNLGAVELTVALHRVYDPMKDRILFDVGHQAYVHKMLTGRMDRFDTLRQKDGLSGFPKPDESPADPFLAGHASDAVSVALGMARARTLLGEDYDVVAVVGDGAMTGGLCYEGLSDAGASREPIVIILNDNGMSINKNVGGIARLISRARIRPGYFKFKRIYRRIMKNMPGLYMFFHRIKEAVKHKLLPQGMFDDMGFYYLGPVDGHDEKALESAVRWGRDLHSPVLIHAVTVKGKGYPPAEAAPELYHGVDRFDPAEGLHDSGKESFSSCFGKTITRLAEADRSVCAVTAAMELGTGLECFSARFPDRFFELGIAEEHAVAMCAGMAKQGMRPVFAVYSSFLQRGFDMLIEDVGFMSAHVVFAVDRAGVVGKDGVTHQGSYDIAYLGTVPGMTVYAPSSFAELESMLKRALFEEIGPVAIRYPRGSEGVYKDDCGAENTSVLRTGKDVTLVCYGSTVNACIMAGEELSRQGIDCDIIKINRVLPLDADKPLASMKMTGRLVVAEDACSQGSVGSRLMIKAEENGICLKGARLLDLGNGMIPHGSVDQLMEALHLDAPGVVSAVLEVLGEKAEA